MSAPGKFKIAGHELKLEASIGIAVFPDDGKTTEELLRHAEIAMYRVMNGSDMFCFYRPERGVEVARRPALAHGSTRPFGLEACSCAISRSSSLLPGD